MAARAELEREITTEFQKIYGQEATFHPGQLDAIATVVAGGRALVVQRTGWGKSLIYFLSTRLLRRRGRGLTLVISPLLALMNDQLNAAARFGLRACTINSNNKEQWEAVIGEIGRNQVDILFIAPERLANEAFNERVLKSLRQQLGMLVVDEAHCISDWGHDFRPDYMRIVRVISYLPENVPLLATTATANDRVIEDIVSQLGEGLAVKRGSLARDSLFIQIIRLGSVEERLVWLVENIPKLPGAGIVYCLTVSDTRKLAAWLGAHGIKAADYSSELPPEERINREMAFYHNELKVLVATTAFGMGVDKSDIGFVIHFQKPGNVIAYYQQIGRAGRAINRAYAILLLGAEDDEINKYFIKSAFPKPEDMDRVMELLEEQGSFKAKELEQRINISSTTVEKVIKQLEIKGDIYKDGSSYYKTPKAWAPDYGHIEAITLQRLAELEEMNQYTEIKGCYMEFITSLLNDSNAKPCGHCANCTGKGFPTGIASIAELKRATEFLKNSTYIIKPRKKWPFPVNGKIGIPPFEQLQEGMALSNYAEAGWGKLVKQDKYQRGYFSPELVQAAVAFLRDKVQEWQLTLVVPVPSLNRPRLVPDFARSLAAALGLRYLEALTKTEQTAEQKLQHNSAWQCKNVLDSLAVNTKVAGNVLLVDDMVDSGWTLTVGGSLLIRNGAQRVYPFALTNTGKRG